MEILMKLLKKIKGRTFFYALAIIIQLAFLVLILSLAGTSSLWVFMLLEFLSFLMAVHVINSESNPSVKLAWIVPLLVFPLFGGVIYVLFGMKHPIRDRKFLYRNADELTSRYAADDTDVMNELEAVDPHAAGQCRYLSNNGFPVFRHTKTSYYPLGDDNFPILLEKLEEAKKFIFMEYFIIEKGEMWGSILEILKRKASQGLDVRLIYDDVGCLFKLPDKYEKELESYGIKCLVFNKFRPFLSIIMNNRDHRKITVIDGNIGFTGGINLADEYINKASKFGHWKDTGVMIEGEAVRNLTLLFLNQWNVTHTEDIELEKFMPTEDCENTESDGFVQPYGDSPLDNEICAENVYLNIINNSKKYLYIFTPYLIIDNETVTALTLAAKRGVDVRIITPGIPDKKIVYQLTRSYYPVLIKHGVKIYEYTPGFVHAKSFVCDDEIATVGSINLDYRSLYLHFECGCFFYKSSIVKDVKEDFLKTLERSSPAKQMSIRTGAFGKIWYALLRLFSPLV